jgi:hypothetical protein
MLAITWAGYYQLHDRMQATNGMLAITFQEFQDCSNTGRDKEFVITVSNNMKTDLERFGHSQKRMSIIVKAIQSQEFLTCRNTGRG